jgi:hypothetical protein
MESLFMIWESFFRVLRPNRKAITPKVMGRMICGIQAGNLEKMTFPIWASFLINFKAAKHSRLQIKKENR